MNIENMKYTKGNDKNKTTHRFNTLTVYLSFQTSHTAACAHAYNHRPPQSKVVCDWSEDTTSQFSFYPPVQQGALRTNCNPNCPASSDEHSAGPPLVFDNNDSVDNVHILTIGPKTATTYC